MSIDFACQNCGRLTRAPESLAGKKGRCKGCGEINIIPNLGEATAYAVAERPEVVAKSQVLRAPEPPPIAVQQVIHVESPKGNALAIAALVLGILASIVGVIPFIGLFAIVLGAIGVLLGGIGLTFALAAKRGGLVPSIIGVALSLLGCVLSVVITGAVSRGMSNSLKEALKEPEAAKPVVAADLNPVANPAPELPKPATNPEPDAVLYPASAMIGDVQIHLTGVVKGKVPLIKEIGGDSASSTDDLLIISMEVANVGRAKKVDYKSYAAEIISYDHASLVDDVDNRYKIIHFGFATKIEGAAGSASIYPGKTITDRVVFELPVDAAQFLILELPGSHLGIKKGVFRFKIPTKDIRPLAP